jgi:hypothetical protein
MCFSPSVEKTSIAGFTVRITPGGATTRLLYTAFATEPTLVSVLENVATISRDEEEEEEEEDGD